ncbi:MULTISPECIES: hypothetical protein [Streptomyces]
MGVASGLCLEVVGAATANGTAVRPGTFNGGSGRDGADAAASAAPVLAR